MIIKLKLVIRYPKIKNYADLKTRELLGTPNVKTRTISSEASIYIEERSTTKVLVKID